MAEKLDYSLLDDPTILQFVFYPRGDWTPPPPEATDHLVPVEEGISIFCRFYPVSRSAPSILYFHGNGEVVCDHDWIAPLYSRIGVNLFVADYRGYGRSGGQPTFSSTAADARVILRYFLDTLESNGYTGPIFVMGRSLGSLSAVELASNYPEEMKGLILESGFADLGRVMRYLGLPLSIPSLDNFGRAGLERIRRIRMPVLIIHGEYDMLIPHSEATTFYENVGSKDKRLLTIPKADHNDIILVGMEQYFEAIREFVFK